MRLSLWPLFFLMVFISAGWAGQGDIQKQLKKHIRQKVIAIVDGDTVILKDQTRVRLVGIQAPKLPLGRKKFKKWPMGNASKQFLSDLILNEYVTLYFGGAQRDRYGRALAHLFREDGLWVQGEMLKYGMARLYSFPDNRAVVPELREQEQLARQAERGIWSLNYYKTRDQNDASKYINSFQIITGLVKDVAKVRGTYYLNFGEDWREDFTIVIKGRTARKFIKAGFPPETYKDQKIEIRGWLNSYNGPIITATHPEQIVIID